MDQYRMIDGKDFTAFLSGFSSFIKKVVLYILMSIKAYFMVFIASLVIIIAMGVWRWYSTKPYYEAEMAFNFTDLTKKDYGEMLHKLDLLAKDHSYKVLSGLLNLPLAETEAIASIEGKNTAGSMLYEDITLHKETEAVYIDVKASDSSVFSHLQPALIAYMNTASPVTYAKKLQDSIDIYNKSQYFINDIATTDSTISVYRALLNTSSSPAISKNELVTLLEHRNTMNDMLLGLMRKSRTYKISVSAVYGFTHLEPLTKERNKNLKLTIGAAIIFACGGAVLSRIIHDINTKNVHV